MILIVPGKSKADVENIANKQLVCVFGWLAITNSLRIPPKPCLVNKNTNLSPINPI